jgi:hypothetical protein
MSEPTAKASIRYEPPAVVRRDSIAGLLGSATAPSDLPIGASDVNVKENILPVRW